MKLTGLVVLLELSVGEVYVFAFGKFFSYFARLKTECIAFQCRL